MAQTKQIQVQGEYSKIVMKIGNMTQNGQGILDQAAYLLNLAKCKRCPLNHISFGCH